MTLNHYKESALVTLVGTYKNAAGALTDPATGTVLYHYEGRGKAGDPNYVAADPATTLVTFTPSLLPQSGVRRQAGQAAGVYEFDVDTTLKPGRWTYGWEGTGAVQNADEQEFIVDNRRLRGPG